MKAGRAANSVIVIGGMDRLESRLVEEAESRGIALKVFSKPAPDLSSRIGNAEALIFFSSRVSHRTRREMMKAAKARNIPVLNCRSCGICMFRDCLECLAGRGAGEVRPGFFAAPGKGRPEGLPDPRAPRKDARETG